MAVAPAPQSPQLLEKRNFFFALSEDQREFLFPGNKNEQLTLRMLSLGYGARDEMHLLVAEGSQGGNSKVAAQTKTMLGLHPNLPALALASTVLIPPVSFKLRSGPGPLYVSGSFLGDPEEAAANSEPASKKAKVSPEAPAVSSAAPSATPAASYVDPLFANTGLIWTGSGLAYPAFTAKDSALAMLAAKNTPQVGPLAYTPTPSLAEEKAQAKIRPVELEPHIREHMDLIKEVVKAKIMESVAKGVKLSLVPTKFERFLLHCHNVSDPYLVDELWKWRQSMK